MNQPDPLPQFEDGQIYFLTGKTLNKLKNAIIAEIVTDKEDIVGFRQQPNKWRLQMAWPAQPANGDHVLTSQDGVLVWEAISDC